MLSKIANFINKYYPAAVAGLILFLVGIWVGQNATLGFLKTGSARTPVSLFNRASPSGVTVDFGEFWNVWDKVTKEHLDKKGVDQQKLLYGAIGGLVNSLGDPYTVFLDPENNKSFNSELSGVYEGVGIEIGSKDGRLLVIAPISGSPAGKAGVLASDVIAKIDGKDTSSMTIPDAVKAIRGQAGTNIKLTLLRDGKAIELDLKRAKITVKSVDFVDKGAGVALIKISRFGDTTKDEWSDAINKFVSEGFSKLILDLRNDPGGRLDTAVYVLGEFVKTGTVMVQEEDANGLRQEFKSDREGRLQAVTPVILVNKGSASASEIVAGGLRDLLGSKLVGEKSFGKGTVQKVEDLTKGAGLHITVAKWLTPKGTWVNANGGLSVDFEVKLTEADIASGKDPQLAKALSLVK